MHYTCKVCAKPPLCWWLLYSEFNFHVCQQGVYRQGRANETTTKKTTPSRYTVTHNHLTIHVTIVYFILKFGFTKRKFIICLVLFIRVRKYLKTQVLTCSCQTKERASTHSQEKGAACCVCIKRKVKRRKVLLCKSYIAFQLCKCVFFCFDLY